MLNCGLNRELGPCRLACGTETSACELYVKVDTVCEAGNCGHPLEGTGCTSGDYGDVHGTVTWNCPGDSTAQAACMLRRLITWGDCAESEQ